MKNVQRLYNRLSPFQMGFAVLFVMGVSLEAVIRLDPALGLTFLAVALSAMLIAVTVMPLLALRRYGA